MLSNNIDANPLVSVLLSTYNEPLDFIAESIDSVLNQTFSDFELLLINDNPKREELDEFLKQYAAEDKRIHYVKNEKNIGLVATLNKGIGLSKGQYIARMDADDISLPNRFECQLKYMQAHNLDIVGCNIIKFDEQGKEISALAVPKHHENIVRYLQWGNCILHPTWMCKKSLYQSLGGYRDVSCCEDYDFVLRAILNGCNAGNCEEFLLRYRVRPESISVSHAAEQQLTSNFVVHQYGKRKVCAIEELNQYYASRQYEKDLHRIQKYYLLKKKVKKEFGVQKISSLFQFMCNRYFYVFGMQYLMKKRYQG